MLSALHQPHDVLAAEFFRTCRHEFFFGKQFLRLFDSAAAGADPRDAALTISRNSRKRASTDSESVYGFRPRHPDTWHVSPWDFCQWFKAIPLRCPSPWYEYSKWTAAGKRKFKNKEPLVAGEDYAFDFAKIRKAAGV